jgi:hypothetical protein
MPVRNVGGQSGGQDADRGGAEEPEKAFVALWGLGFRVLGHDIGQRGVTHAADDNLLATAQQAGLSPSDKRDGTGLGATATFTAWNG